MRASSLCVIAWLTLPTGIALGQVSVTEGSNFSLDVAADGRIVIDLLGKLSVLPSYGGAATALTDGALPARRPRWSPDDSAIAYQVRGNTGSEIWLYRFADESTTKLSNTPFADQHPDWHPDGTRLAFSTERHGSGMDLWEMDVATGVSWRLTNLPGDETEPSWSGDGRNLAYIHESDGRWQLMIRRFGDVDRAAVSSDVRLSAPSYRPDGSLVTFTRHDAGGARVDMVILSQPPLERTLIDAGDLADSPLAWLGREDLYYVAEGGIRRRHFNSWVSRSVPFNLTIGKPGERSRRKPVVRTLPAIDEPESGLVLRAARLFDGVTGQYRGAVDVIIDRGRIVAVEDQRDRDGAIIIDMGNLTVMPGLIDAFAALPDDTGEALGPLLLASGVTTMIARHDGATALNARWSGDELPGPRLLAATDVDDDSAASPWLVTVSGDGTAGERARQRVERWHEAGVAVLAESWQAGLGSGASIFLGADTLLLATEHGVYQGIIAGSDLTMVSGLADARTPGMASLLNSRQAVLMPIESRPQRRFDVVPDMSAAATWVIAGSRPNGVAPGLALHAELRALTAAGLAPEQALRAAGVNAANALGFGLQLGRVATGSVADLVVVDGDPLERIGDALNVVAVVRNGRFFSAIGLIERLPSAANVE